MWILDSTPIASRSMEECAIGWPSSTSTSSSLHKGPWPCTTRSNIAKHFQRLKNILIPFEIPEPQARCVVQYGGECDGMAFISQHFQRLKKILIPLKLRWIPKPPARCVMQYGGECDWMNFIYLDEFLYAQGPIWLRNLKDSKGVHDQITRSNISKYKIKHFKYFQRQKNILIPFKLHWITEPSLCSMEESAIGWPSSTWTSFWMLKDPSGWGI